MKFQQHKERWIGCRRCNLWKKRTNVVLARGRIPADVLLIGEAPGASEDVLGRPFVGPAGKLLDEMISHAAELASYRPQLLFSNLVACIPLEDEGEKAGEPPKWAIQECAGRLKELHQLARPKAVVSVGGLAAKWTDKLLNTSESVDSWFSEIIHPAAILRMGQPQRGLAAQRVVITLRDVFLESQAHR